MDFSAKLKNPLPNYQITKLPNRNHSRIILSIFAANSLWSEAEFLRKTGVIKTI